MGKSGVKRLEALQRSLLGLHGELTETFTWTALLCDGLCGLMTEHSPDIDPATQTGMRFATIWLKRRNQGHATHLQAACGMLQEIRERQRRLQLQMPSSNKLGGRK
jgi:hypothetical protein